jgi:hypothetical protein
MIVAWDYKSVRGSNKLLTCICSVCSLDTELYPYGSIKGTYKDIKKGVQICGCSKFPAFNPEQYNIKITRRLTEDGYILEEPIEVFNSKSTLQLFNPKTNNRWNPTVKNYLNGSKDPIESQNNKTRSTEDLLIEFTKAGVYPTGTVFCREDKTLWKVYCPLCAKDLYTRSGTCNNKGVFLTRQSSLRKGSKPCRCNGKVIRNSNMLIFDIRLALKLKDISVFYIKPCTNNTSKDSLVVYTCVCGVQNTTLSCNILNGRYGCTSCSKFGYDKAKAGHFYIFRWTDSVTSWLKYGISNSEVSKRISQQSSAAKHKLQHEELFIVTDPRGDKIWDIERNIKQVFGRKGFIDKIVFPDGYTETVEDTPANYKLLLSFTKALQDL